MPADCVHGSIGTVRCAGWPRPSAAHAMRPAKVRSTYTTLDAPHRAVKRADGAAALIEVVKRGKRGEVSERTQAAAYAAYVKVL